MEMPFTRPLKMKVFMVLQNNVDGADLQNENVVYETIEDESRGVIFFKQLCLWY